jgi:hypothetical protein
MSGQSHLSRDKIHLRLKELNGYLARDNKRIHVTLCGGAVMVLYGARDETDDIDSMSAIPSNIQRYGHKIWDG